jgi:hypothetical protein
VKDSLEAKTDDGSRNLIGVVYAPIAEPSPEELETLLADFAARLTRHAGGVAQAWRLP